MTRSVELDAVIVCTPPVSHVEIASACVKRGIAVLVEKPFAIRPDDARDLILRADAAGVLVTMASKFRYVDDVVEARRMIESGRIGDAIMFENVFSSRVDMAGRWNSDPTVSGGGVLMDNGTHSVDIARYLLGPVTEVSASESLRVQGLEVEESARLSLRTVGGSMGTIDVSWSIDKANETYIAVYGAEGAVEIRWKGSRVRTTSSPDWTPFGSGYDKVGAMRAQVLNLCGAIRAGESLRITATDAIASVDVVAAAYLSLASDRWEAVREPIVRSLDGTSSGSHVA